MMQNVPDKERIPEGQYFWMQVSAQSESALPLFQAYELEIVELRLSYPEEFLDCFLWGLKFFDLIVQFLLQSAANSLKFQCTITEGRSFLFWSLTKSMPIEMLQMH